MNPELFLAIFTLMLIALGVNLIAGKSKIPYTVLLVIVGSWLVPISRAPSFSFLTSFKLTPDSLFFVFLPILIFESAYNMNFRDVKENKFSVGILAVIGLLISTLFIGFVGQWAFTLLGMEVPLFVTILFGAIISSTDPVAVLSLFKEYGAPHRLTLIFEGESLFNDATSFALYMVFLEICIHGFHGSPTLLTAMFSFSSMLLGGVLFGLFMGFMFSSLIQLVKGNEHLEITLTLLVAHFTFILTELISNRLVMFGHHIHLSSIISTSIASMVMGNYGRFKMSHGVEIYMEKFWSYFAFVANSLVFILMGLMFAGLSIKLDIALMPILVTIMVVVIARAVSVYTSVTFINTLKLEEYIPQTWQALLSWGSLRGALAIVMVLLIPDNLTLPGWRYDFSIKEFITAITIGCIYFSLLVKATSIGFVIRKLKIDALSSQEELSYHKSKALVYNDILTKLQELYQQKQISSEQYESMAQCYRKLYAKQADIAKQKSTDSERINEDMLSLYALSLEKSELNEIFRRDEINEAGYKKILNILEMQIARVQAEKQQRFAPNEFFSERFAKRFLNAVRKVVGMQPMAADAEEVYLYYRTQYKLISKVLHQLKSLENSRLMEVFNDQEAITNIYHVYVNLLESTEKHMKSEIKTNQVLLDKLNRRAANNLLKDIKNDTLNELLENDIINTKLYISLKKELF